MKPQNWDRYDVFNAPMRPELLTVFWTEYVQTLFTAEAVRLSTVPPHLVDRLRDFIDRLAANVYELELAHPEGSLLGMAPNFPPQNFGQYRDTIRVLFTITLDNFDAVDAKSQNNIKGIHASVKALDRIFNEIVACSRAL